MIDMLICLAYNFDMVASAEVRKFLAKAGRKGGASRARRLESNARCAQARHAAIARWMKKRFGSGSAEEMGLPGWEIFDAGMKDLVEGKTSGVSALAVAEVRPRLRFLGVPVPSVADSIVNAREKLYRAVEDREGDMAHARFAAILERLDGLCDALASRAKAHRLPAHLARAWHR